MAWKPQVDVYCFCYEHMPINKGLFHYDLVHHFHFIKFVRYFWLIVYYFIENPSFSRPLLFPVGGAYLPWRQACCRCCCPVSHQPPAMIFQCTCLGPAARLPTGSSFSLSMKVGGVSWMKGRLLGRKVGNNQGTAWNSSTCNCTVKAHPFINIL